MLDFSWIHSLAAGHSGQGDGTTFGGHDYRVYQGCACQEVGLKKGGGPQWTKTPLGR